jgi:hypothetical protein
MHSPQYNCFQTTLARLLKKHGDSCGTIADLLGGSVHVGTVKKWRAGTLLPRWTSSKEALFKIEQHYHLEPGYLARKLARSRLGYQRRYRKMERFHSALNDEMLKHGDTNITLAAAIERKDFSVDPRLLRTWTTGLETPRHRRSFEVLERIQNHYGLPNDYFANLLAKPDTLLAQAFRTVQSSEKNTLRWHLPRDFNNQPLEKQKEILAWISANVMPKSTTFGKWHHRICQVRFKLMFPSLDPVLGGRNPKGYQIDRGMNIDARGSYGNVAATARHTAELASLITFKTSVLPPTGFHRRHRWKPVTASMATYSYGLIFGALAAAPLSDASGLGVPLKDFTFALLVFPEVWDWYLHWRERRRGFFTISERSNLYDAKELVRERTGWLRQHPELARRLRPIDGLLSKRAVARAQADWSAASDSAYRYVCGRIEEVRRVEKIHRDPFEPIFPIINSSSPLSEYKKIADEIIRLMPDEKSAPVKVAIAVRGYLMVRFGMHTGLRQRNLRELLLCAPGKRARTLVELQQLERGEIRWSQEERRWEILIPANAFKNSGSQFFSGRPYRLALPDLNDLYKYIDAYVLRHRLILLGGYPDPGSFFVRTFLSAYKSKPHDTSSYYNAWIDIIQRYGIYNPYTGKGAIPGLLPHGPHCVRDVIATHILKQTGSYELAGFALQDTTAAVMKHYSRFAPHEKSAMAAEVLNRVWGKPTRKSRKVPKRAHRLNATPPVERQLYPIGRPPGLD